MLKDCPEMPATVLAERVGWTGSITWFRENVKRLRRRFTGSILRIGVLLTTQSFIGTCLTLMHFARH